jgi:hypothetical protein
MAISKTPVHFRHTNDNQSMLRILLNQRELEDLSKRLVFFSMLGRA